MATQINLKLCYPAEPESRRKGDWFQTFTGRKFWPLDPRPDGVSIRDIAHALANICRFGGHVRKFYSVAQHSLMVSRLCPRYPLEGLLHDATEAYIGDMVRPLKIFMPDYQKCEALIGRAIADRFGIADRAYHVEVKHADNLALVTERRDIMVPSGHKWAPELEAMSPLPGRIRTNCFLSWRAEFQFLAEFDRLMKLRRFDKSQDPGILPVCLTSQTV